MYQPLPIAYEESVGFVNREVVHDLRLVDKLNCFDFAVAAIGAADVVPNFEIACRYPFVSRGVEGMLRRGFQ